MRFLDDRETDVAVRAQIAGKRGGPAARRADDGCECSSALRYGIHGCASEPKDLRTRPWRPPSWCRTRTSLLGASAPGSGTLSRLLLVVMAPLLIGSRAVRNGRKYA